MGRNVLLVLVASATAHGQASPGRLPATGSISGVVRDAITNAPPKAPRASSDEIEKLWLARSRAQEVEIGAGATIQITIEPLKID